MKRRYFKKLRENAPMISPQGEVIKERAGGIKLEYNVSATDNIRIRIGKRDVYIPYWKYSPIKLVFLRPLKSQWDMKKYKISKNHQGKPKDLFTHLWIILKNPAGHTNCYDDVVDIKKDYESVRIKTLCTKKEHHEMIKHLEKREDRFSVPYEQIFF